jgi:hypothetical protein
MKIVAVLMMLGLVVGMVGCGTEDDPTIGVDAGNYTDEAASTVGASRCHVTNGVLDGRCQYTGPCLLGAASSSCPVGATPVRLGTMCVSSTIDTGRYCISGK